jgi:DNA gyrase subunit B
MEKSKQTSYTAQKIQVLKGLEGVRKRPSMYIGDTGSKGLHHLVYEAVDNSIDEALAGFCDLIQVIIKKDNSIIVLDNGRGIPADIHHELGISGVEVVMTTLHSGGKFDKDTYKISGGLHGVGISVVNALSSWLKVEINQNGKTYTQSYAYGKTSSKLEVSGDTNKTGTSVHFLPDDSIFSETTYEYDILSNRLRELAFLNNGIKIQIKDERTEKEETFQSEGGIKDFVSFLNSNKTSLHNEIIYFSGNKDNVEVDISLQYTNEFRENLYSFVNNINTHEGGTHLTGFRTALTRTVNDYIKKRKLSNTGLSGEDLKEGLTCIISIKVPEPHFEGQTKTKLGNLEIKGIVDNITSVNLSTFFEENPDIAKIICEKAILSSKARDAARKARDLTRRKSALESGSLPGKLADCQSKDATKSEIFIVEGESAAGSSKQGRSREFQAILPLKGKILNVEKSRLSKILANKEITTLISALGSGVDEEFDVQKLRYHKIIIMTDADIDGNHITTLLLTFFYRYMKPLVEGGYLYLATPPLYCIKSGKKTAYIYNEKGRVEYIKSLGEVKSTIQRYKGLGEMNPDQLWKTTMNPDNRILKQIVIEDAIMADQLFTTLMGSEVEPRRDFIHAHAKEVKNLDV